MTATNGTASGETGGLRPKSVLREYFETVVICVIFVVFSRAFVFQQSKIPTGSMKDTLLEGDYIMVNRYLYADPDATAASLFPVRDVQRGDVVVFRWPGDMDQDYIKRVVGLPGEVVQVRGHRAWIDGEAVEPVGTDIPYLSCRMQEHQPRAHGTDRWNPYLHLGDLGDASVKASWPASPGDCLNHKLRPDELALARVTPFEPVLMDDGSWGCRVPDDAYFMMGDNRNRSSDSRIWLALPRSLIKGRAWLIWYSYEEDANDHYRTGLKRLYSMGKKLVLFPVRTNWRRIFTLIR